MAIRFECDNVVVSVKDIEEKYPGGYENFKKETPRSVYCWYDGNLVRLGDDPWMSNGLEDRIGFGIKAYCFQEEPPKEWKSYPAEFHVGCTPLIMWTNEMPEEPLVLEDGWCFQGGLYYKSYFIWQKANRWLVNWDNPNCLLYHLHKGEIVKGY